ncbi:MAG TPA: XisH family protein [Coleofasciculaceae cyanobacterium]
MSAKDLFHEAVKLALQKEQWTITDDPLRVKFGDIRFQIDLGAEQLLAAEKADAKIAVEIKSFLGSSAITDFHTALGQFLNYQIALEANDPDRKLYLAVPEDTYKSFFQGQLAQVAIQRYKIRLVVYNPTTEEIVEWRN